MRMWSRRSSGTIPVHPSCPKTVSASPHPPTAPTVGVVNYYLGGFNYVCFFLFKVESGSVAVAMVSVVTMVILALLTFAL